MIYKIDSSMLFLLKLKNIDSPYAEYSIDSIECIRYEDIDKYIRDKQQLINLEIKGFGYCEDTDSLILDKKFNGNNLHKKFYKKFNEKYVELLDNKIEKILYNIL